MSSVCATEFNPSVTPNTGPTAAPTTPIPIPLTKPDGPLLRAPSMGLENSPVTPDASPETNDPPPSRRLERTPSLAASAALLCFSALICKNCSSPK